MAEVKLVCLLRALKALGLYILNFYMISWGASGSVIELMIVSRGISKLCLGFVIRYTIFELLFVGNIVSEVE